MRTSLQHLAPSSEAPGEALKRLFRLRQQALQTGVAVIDLKIVRDDIAARLIQDEAERQLRGAK